MSARRSRCTCRAAPPWPRSASGRRVDRSPGRALSCRGVAQLVGDQRELPGFVGPRRAAVRRPDRTARRGTPPPSRLGRRRARTAAASAGEDRGQPRAKVGWRIGGTSSRRSCGHSVGGIGGGIGRAKAAIWQCTSRAWACTTQRERRDDKLAVERPDPEAVRGRAHARSCTRHGSRSVAPGCCARPRPRRWPRPCGRARAGHRPRAPGHGCRAPQPASRRISA